MIVSLLIFAISLATLIYASNVFIDSAEKIGLSFGVSPFIIGVTIVALGTSLPELSTSILAVQTGSSSIVIGNVVGSNLTNILLVLGISALIAGTLEIERNIMNEDVPLLIGSAFLLWFVCRDLHFSLVESLIFLSGMGGFLVYSISHGKQEKSEKVSTGWLTYILLVIGAVAVYFSAKYTVISMEDLAQYFDVSPAIVSLSLLALGTSLPEVVVSAAAVRKGMHNMALGNIIGSNIFNTYAVMAIPSYFGELEIPEEVLHFSMPFMIAVTILFGLVCYSKKVSVWKAGMLIAFYIFYLVELIRVGFVN